MLADIIGYNHKKAGGNIVSCGTLAILAALTIVRDNFSDITSGKGKKGPKIAVITSKAAHLL